MLDHLHKYLRSGLRENAYGHVSRLAYFEEHLPEKGSILDFGCGTGVMTTLPLLQAGHDVTGVDLDPASIDYGRERAAAMGLDPLALVCADLRTLEGRYDAIIATEVFEHIPSPQLEELLELLVDKLRPGGTLIATVPNGWGWAEAEAWAWRVFRLGEWSERLRIRWFVENVKLKLVGDFVDCQYLSSLDSSPHVQKFSLGSLERRLENAGLRHVHGRGSVLCSGPVSHLLFTGLVPLMALNLFLGRVLSPLAASFWMVLRKPADVAS